MYNSRCYGSIPKDYDLSSCGKDITIGVIVSSPDDIVDFSDVKWPADMEALTLYRHYAHDIDHFVMNVEDQGLLRGLNLPDSVHTLDLDDQVRSPHKILADFHVGDGLLFFSTIGVGLDDVVHVCSKSTKMMGLSVTLDHFPDALGWIPKTVDMLMIRAVSRRM